VASITDRILSTLAPEYRQLRADVTALQTKVDQLMVKQDDVNKKFDTLTAALAGIRADIDALKAASSPGEPMSQENFDRLSAISDAFASLDAETQTQTSEG
jgi:ABC-type transporter Mla subunit MlaD